MKFDTLLNLHKYFQFQKFDFVLLERLLNYDITDSFDIGTDEMREILESILRNSTGAVDEKAITLIWNYFKDDYGSEYLEKDGEWIESGEFQSFEIDFYEYHFQSILLIASHESTPKELLQEIESYVLPLADECELDLVLQADLAKAIASNPNYKKTN